ncbi:MAG: enoyl-CoA hydratase/isomerase family protein [Candidatus Eremiobacteraeota bacterium]|nr:enoyl-CoA hydratase/isomerase family protein [Candidatus Eremiobacteraeota bacterium]
MFTTIELERADGIAVLTLNRPAVLNALSIALLDELAAALDELEEDRSTRAVVLTGSGEKAFAAGADIAEFETIESAVAGAAFARRGQAIVSRIGALRVPVIAAVNGFALGGGCELALACDIRIASRNAKFGQPEVNLGLIPGYGGTQRLTRLVGMGMAMYLCLSGEMIDAEAALRAGLVQKVVAPEELLGEAKRVAAAIAAKAPLAVEAAKRAIADGSQAPLEEGLAIEALHFGSVTTTQDFREGTKAFLEKRKPAFSGR